MFPLFGSTLVLYIFIDTFVLVLSLSVVYYSQDPKTGLFQDWIMNDWDQQIQYHFENCAIFKPLKSECVQILDSQSIPKATSVVSTILYLMFFLSFSYCGVCYSQVELSISYVRVQKSSSGDGNSLLSLLFWKEKDIFSLPLTFVFCL